MKPQEELLSEEGAVDLVTPVQMPPEVRQIFERCMDSIGHGTPRSEIDLSTLATNNDVSDLLWWMYQNPDNECVAYLPKRDAIPSTLREYAESGYVTITYRDHYYRRTQQLGDWYRLPEEYWSREGDALDETWPPHLRKILRNSERHCMLELKLTQRAERSAEQMLARHEIQQATDSIREAVREPVVEAKPGMFGFSLNLLSLKDWWQRWRRQKGAGSQQR